MDPRWWPWCWAAAAAVCAGLFTMLQPWRREFRAGLEIAVGQKMGCWLIPAALLAADALAEAWRKGILPDQEFTPVGQGTAESLLRAVHGFGLGDGAALVAGVALALDAGGLRRGLRKGVESVMAGRGGAGVMVILLMSLSAVVVDFSLCRLNLALGWRVIFSLLEAPLAGWVSSLVLAGLLLVAETRFRAPEKIPHVHWLETAAAHSARLWPWALAHSLLWLGGRWLPESWQAAAVLLLLLPGLVLIFAPLVFLHVKRYSDASEGWAVALAMWGRKGWQVLAWGAVAGLWCFLWSFAGGWLAREPGIASWGIRITLASLHGLAHTWLTVALLGAWTALRLRDLPPPPSPPATSRPATRRTSSSS